MSCSHAAPLACMQPHAQFRRCISLRNGTYAASVSLSCVVIAGRFRSVVPTRVPHAIPVSSKCRRPRPLPKTSKAMGVEAPESASFNQHTRVESASCKAVEAPNQAQYRILFLTNAHNSMSQRLSLELRNSGHEVHVVLAVNEDTMRNAVARTQHDLIVCPFLTKKIPSDIYTTSLCLVVHPGVPGDRGPHSLDWAILQGRRVWGVTVLQADEEMDAGPIWGTQTFAPARPNHTMLTKSSMYRHEAVSAAVAAVKQALDRFSSGLHGQPLDYRNPQVFGTLMPSMKQADRQLDWNRPASHLAVKIAAADSCPGALCAIAGRQYFAFNARVEDPTSVLALSTTKSSASGNHISASTASSPITPGTIIGWRQDAVCIMTGEGLLWVGHLKCRQPLPHQAPFKLPAAMLLQGTGALDNAVALPDPPMDYHYGFYGQTHPVPATWQEIWRVFDGPVCYVHFEFYNGAMNTRQCRALARVLQEVAHMQAVKVVVLMGGYNFWSNGIHLNTIEAADDPAAESWLNITAMDDMVREIFSMTDKITVAALQGNAGAGGAMAALAADLVWAHPGVVLNPHYKTMGLFGSEYWTYFLPRRVGAQAAAVLTQTCQPLLASQAKILGLVDDVLYRGVPPADLRHAADTVAAVGVADGAADNAGFQVAVRQRALRLVHGEAVWMEARLQKKLLEFGPGAAGRQAAEQCRLQELERMREDFQSIEYQAARHAFVMKVQPATTPEHIYSGEAVEWLLKTAVGGTLDSKRLPPVASQHTSSAVPPGFLGQTCSGN